MIESNEFVEGERERETERAEFFLGQSVKMMEGGGVDEGERSEAVVVEGGGMANDSRGWRWTGRIDAGVLWTRSVSAEGSRGRDDRDIDVELFSALRANPSGAITLE